MPIESATIAPPRARTTRACTMAAPARPRARKALARSERARVHTAFLERLPIAGAQLAYERTKSWWRRHGGAWARNLD